MSEINCLDTVSQINSICLLARAVLCCNIWIGLNQWSSTSLRHWNRYARLNNNYFQISINNPMSNSKSGNEYTLGYSTVIEFKSHWLSPCKSQKNQLSHCCRRLLQRFIWLHPYVFSLTTFIFLLIQEHILSIKNVYAPIVVITLSFSSNHTTNLLVMIYQLVEFVINQVRLRMMTSSNGNIFRVTGHLCGEFTGPRWIPHTKANDAELWCLLLICVWINGCVNNREAGDLRRYCVPYGVTVMENLVSETSRSTIFLHVST